MILSANPTKWSNTPKQFIGNLSTNCLIVVDHFVPLALTGSGSFPEICANENVKSLKLKIEPYHVFGWIFPVSQKERHLEKKLFFFLSSSFLWTIPLCKNVYLNPSKTRLTSSVGYMFLWKRKR